MSPAEQARIHLQSLLARGLAMALTSDSPRITGASEIWGGVAPRDKSGWYLWLRNQPGAYGLDLEDAEPSLIDGEPVVRARSSIRYYPSRSEPRLDCWTPAERAVVSGAWLDTTGAPDVMRAASIDPALFVVGALEVTIDATRGTRILSVGAPERVGGVPTWDLARVPFIALATFVAQVERRSAIRLVELDDASYRSALVAFDPAASCRHALVEYLDPEAVVIRDEPLSGSVPEDAERAHSIRIPPAWFAEGAPAPQRLGCCR